MLEINRIYNQDCMVGLKQIEDNSVDCIITDPPYGIDFQSAWRIEKERFDKIDNDGKPFVWWLFDAYRILKDRGRLICFCRWDVQDAFKQAIEWAGFSLKSQIIWDREIHGLGDLNKQFAPQHDIIWYATKGDYIFKNGRPKSVIRIRRVNAENLNHPNEKPMSLMRHLVKVLTEKDEIVLDCFVGSGSTLLACKQMERRFIGFEIDKYYCDVANTRLLQGTLHNLIQETEVKAGCNADSHDDGIPPNTKELGILPTIL